MLRCIQRSETDPYYNLAAEEYLLKTAAVNTFMTWRNEPSVIIGKHQNTSREINHSFIATHNLPVIRRITGGGTVYHDYGNINYSFIYTDRKENLVDFRFFTEPVILFLKSFGLHAAFEGKNNITVSGIKVSGNSAHIHKQKVLHHGTLLFSTDLDMLENAIAGHEKLYNDKAVSSIRSKVHNISKLVDADISVNKFIILFQSFIFNHFAGAYNDQLNEVEIASIKILAEEKYRTKEWNYRYSPGYEFNTEWEMQDGKYSISLEVKQGLIMKAELTGPQNKSLFLDKLATQMTGVLHEKNSIGESMKKLTFANKNEGQVMNQIIRHLF